MEVRKVEEKLLNGLDGNVMIYIYIRELPHLNKDAQVRHDERIRSRLYQPNTLCIFEHSEPSDIGSM